MKLFNQESSIVYKIKNFIDNIKKYSGFYRPG